MAYLNGLQDHFVMVGGQQSARSLPHLAELFRLADRAGMLRDPDMARRRMVRVLSVHGIARCAQSPSHPSSRKPRPSPRLSGIYPGLRRARKVPALRDRAHARPLRPG